MTTIRATGEMELDEGSYADSWDHIDNNLDEEEMKDTYPEMYTWTCCQLQGDEAGCKESPHRKTRKKAGHE